VIATSSKLQAAKTTPISFIMFVCLSGWM
jgi:hypothetical protein